MTALLTVTIEKLCFGGAGLARHGGKALFVPFTAPGDIVKVRIKREKRSYLEGEAVEIVRPSPTRADPPCPVFSQCGGCQWQHLHYREQLRAKEEIFAEILNRGARVGREKIGTIIPSPHEFSYRSRVQLKIRYIEGAVHMGFYRPGSHYVIDIPDCCLIADPRINPLLGGLRRMLGALPDAGKVPQVDVAVGEDGRVELVVHYIGSDMEETADHFLRYSQESGIDAVFLQTGRKESLAAVGCGEFDPLAYALPDPCKPENFLYSLEFSHGGFSQVNYSQNRLIAGKVFEWAGLKGGERVLDLYCGNGNFSIPLSGMASYILGIEDYPASISSARVNCSRNSVGNMEFRCMDAVSAVETLIAENSAFDLVILDPPRSGAREVVSILPRLQARRIIYVSCDPMTMARDAAILIRNGYSVLRSVPADMFPQTYHIESVTLFEHDS